VKNSGGGLQEKERPQSGGGGGGALPGGDFLDKGGGGFLVGGAATFWLARKTTDFSKFIALARSRGVKSLRTRGKRDRFFAIFCGRLLYRVSNRIWTV